MTDEKLKVLQNKILEVVEYFDGFCRENNIVYYLMGGSALGAMRHQGFIPWDDDFDVFMDYENYAKFLDVAEKKLDCDTYYLQKEDTEEWPMYFSKIRIHDTTFIEKDVVGREMHHGIYIDIMCLNNTPSNKFLRYIQYFSARILNTKALVEKGYITNNRMKKIFLSIAKFTITKPVKNILLAYVRRFNKKNTLMVGHFFGRAPFTNTSFPYVYLGTPRYVKFDRLMLPVPEQVEEYLTIRYGHNYMQVPSDSVKVQYPSHAYIVDTERSYTEYYEKSGIKEKV